MCRLLGGAGWYFALCGACLGCSGEKETGDTWIYRECPRWAGMPASAHRLKGDSRFYVDIPGPTADHDVVFHESDDGGAGTEVNVSWDSSCYSRSDSGSGHDAIATGWS